MKAFITALTIALAVCVISGCDDDEDHVSVKAGDVAATEAIAVENEVTLSMCLVNTHGGP